jgi:2-polyprenyl-3-methyl-5-hydroxy-6-metoxy-1,4-benzoquinol methylase
MGTSGFEPVAESLRDALGASYANGREPIAATALQATLDTNSVLVERRGAPLLDVLFRELGVASLAGVELLDVGCGYGALALYFAFHGASVTAIDPHEHRIAIGQEIADRHGLAARFERAHAQRLEGPDGAFDVAVQNNSLCYIVPRADRDAALRHVHRVLRPGGVLLVRDPNRWHPRDQFTRLPLVQLLPPRQARAVAERAGRTRSNVRVVSPVAARRELRRAGFGRVRQVTLRTDRRGALLKPVGRYHLHAALRHG